MRFRIMGAIGLFIVLLGVFPLGASAQYTVETSMTIPLNGSSSGSMDASHAEYWWKVTIPSDGALVVSTYASSGLDIDLYLFENNNGTYVNLAGHEGGSTVESSTRFNNLLPGTYYIKATRWTGTGTYTISSSFTAASLDNDPTTNDTAENALAISYNGSDTGHLGYYAAGYTDIEDWWKITIPSDGGLKVATTSTSTVDIDMYLYEKRGDVFVNIAGNEGGSSVDAWTQFANLIAGTYYVKAYRWNGYGSYTITPTFTPTSLANDPEVNDSSTSPVTLAYNGSDTGHLGFYKEGYTDLEDWWVITIPSDGKLVVSTQSDATLDIDPYLYEKNGDSYVNIAGHYGGSGTDDGTTFANLIAGTYYVKAYRWNGYGSYTIASSFTPSSMANDDTTNDTPDHSSTLAYNGSDTGHLGYYAAGYTDLEDWWQITIPSDGKLFVSTVADSTLEIDLYFHELNGESYVNIKGYDIGSGVNESTHVVNLMPGTYFIKAYRWNGYGSYSISSTFTPASLANDDTTNDTPDHSSSLAYNGSDTGHLGFYKAGYTDLEDWWKVTIPADGKLLVSTESDATLEIDLYMHELNSGNYNSIKGYDIGSGVNESTNVVNLIAGTYYIKVYRWTGYGSYTIRSVFTPARYANDPEINDSLETASPLQVNTGETGHLGHYASGYTDTHDWYAFTVPASWDSLFVRIMSDEQIEIDANIHNASGVNIAHDGRSGIETIFYMASPGGGNYYLDVYRWTGYGSYAVIVSDSWRADVPVVETPDTGSGNIAGRIYNGSNNANISGATLSLIPGGYSATTGANGTYSFTGLSPETFYTLVVSATGFETKIVRNIEVIGGQTTTADCAMTSKITGPFATNLIATPSTTVGADEIAVEALVSVNGVDKIAPFTSVVRVDQTVIAGKGVVGKPAQISAYEVSNSIIRASVNDTSGEFYITTATGKSLLYTSFYSGKTVVRIDGVSYRLGTATGSWITPLSASGTTVSGTWRSADVPDITVTMNLSIVKSTTTGEFDTFKISYALANSGSTSHSVGLYKLLDTTLNGNDEAPVSAGDGYNLNERAFTGSSIPNFWQAYEESPTQVSTKMVAQGTLYGGGAVKPDRFIIAGWSRLEDAEWDYTPSGTYNDSAVGMWWDPVAIAGGGSRTVVTLYGLGAVETVTGDIALAVSSESQLSVENNHLVPNPFQVNALVTNTSGKALSNVTLLIEYPSGLALASGETASKNIGSLADGGSAQVQWLITAVEKTTEQIYSYAVTVTTSTTNVNSNSVPKTILVPAVAASTPLTVTAAEVFIDTDPGEGAAQAMNAKDGGFDESSEQVSATVGIANLEPGYHMVFVRGRDSNGVWGKTASYLINKTYAADEIAPPSNVRITDIPDDQGHSLTVSWALSSDDASLTEYRIFRSRNATVTTPVLLSAYTTIDALKAAEMTTTIQIATVPAGTKTYTDNGVPVSNVPYYYWVQAVSSTGVSKLAAAEAATNVEERPAEFSVAAPYPNPFNPATTIRYTIPEAARVRLVVFDTLGREVALLEDSTMEAGLHETVWDARTTNGDLVASGMYLFRIEAGGHTAGGKMLYLR